MQYQLFQNPAKEVFIRSGSDKVQNALKKIAGNISSYCLLDEFKKQFTVLVVKSDRRIKHVSCHITVSWVQLRNLLKVEMKVEHINRRNNMQDLYEMNEELEKFYNHFIDNIHSENFERPLIPHSWKRPVTQSQYVFGVSMILYFFIVSILLLYYIF